MVRSCRRHPFSGRAMMDSNPQAVAEHLNEWFRSVLHFTDSSLFSIAPEGPHRDAVILDVLKRNARIIAAGKLDRNGELYSPLCLFLAAACRRLAITLGPGHWRAAVDNLIQLQSQTE